jgi:hypothetical protein
MIRVRHFFFRLRHDEEGASEGLSLVLVIPSLIALIMILVGATRLALAGNAAEIAASSASHSAALQRSAQAGVASARSAAEASLAASGFTCLSTNTTVDSSRATTNLAQIGYMGVTVQCTVALSDLTLLPLPGSMTVTRSATSPISAYMERQN